jgi:site-specific DNA-cytosine methylase
LEKNKYFILIACEESQRVTKAFHDFGFTNTFSCDIVEPSGDMPEFHIKDDIRNILKDNGTYGYTFSTLDGVKHKIPRFDMMIAFPPCTYLSVVGNRSFTHGTAEAINKRWDNRYKALDFVKYLYEYDPIPFVAIENPVGYLNTHWKKPSQIVHPYFFGDPWTKRTCLWLRNLPLLQKVNVVTPIFSWHDMNNGSKDRSILSPRFAQEMALQWGMFLEHNEQYNRHLETRGIKWN